jgi:hypothetical protein
MVERKGMSTIRGWSKNVENLYLLILMILYSLTPATRIYLPQTQSLPQVAKMVLFLGTSGSRHAERYQQGHRPRARGRSPRQAPAVLTVSGIILKWIKSTCHRSWRMLALPIVVLWLWLSIVYLSIASKGNTEESAASRNLWTWCTSWLEHSFATSENYEIEMK